MSFKISEKYKNTDWTSLNLVDENSENWNKAISIIEDRFNSRFFNQINRLKKNELSGFLIMSIDCLLIETFMQFYLGKESTEDSYSGNQWKSFKDFLKNSNHFNSEFNTNKKCHVFYKHFRCGLLHQAQTKGNSKIKINQPAMLTFIDQSNIEIGLIIDRKEFHKRLTKEFEDYLERLRNNEANFKGENLRINGLAKMNLITKE